MKNKLPILCVDFDGVLHSYSSGWKGATAIPDPPVLGAFEFLDEATKHFQVCIYSSRSRYLFGRRAIKKWLKQHLEAWFLEKNPDLIELDPFGADRSQAKTLASMFVAELKFPTRKPAAFLQLDDRAITFVGKFPTIEDIKAFKPWNKK